MWSNVSLLNAVAFWGLWIAAISGGTAAIAGLAGGLAATRASDITGKAAEIKIAEANARAQLARLETAKIALGLAWREMSPMQSQALSSALAGVDFEVWLTYVGSDPEAANLRSQVQAAFDAAGVKTNYFSGWEQAAGVSVLGEAGPQRDKIFNALKQAGLNPIAKPPHDGYFGKKSPCILIGTKRERL